MYIFQEKEELVFVDKKAPYKCIRVNIIKDKLFKLLAIYIGYTIILNLFGSNTFEEYYYLFKDNNNNFNLVHVKKGLYHFSYYGKQNQSLDDYELLFTNDIDLIFKAIKKTSKKRESRLSLLFYDELFEEIIEKLEEGM